MSSLYEPLPPHIKHDSSRLNLQELQCSTNKYVQTFINKRLPENVNKDEIVTKMKQKGVMLDSINTNKKKKRKKCKIMSAHERRKRGIFKIPKENQRYAMFLPLHEMWKDYIINETLGNLDSGQHINAKLLLPKLVKADYHGAIITVSKSKCPAYVGLSGILLQETKNVFKIITKEDKIKTVPKANSVFTVSIDGYICTLYGNHLRLRSADRSSKKFKTRSTTDL